MKDFHFQDSLEKLWKVAKSHSRSMVVLSNNHWIFVFSPRVMSLSQNWKVAKSRSLSMGRCASWISTQWLLGLMFGFLRGLWEALIIIQWFARNCALFHASHHVKASIASSFYHYFSFHEISKEPGNYMDLTSN